MADDEKEADEAQEREEEDEADEAAAAEAAKPEAKAAPKADNRRDRRNQRGRGDNRERGGGAAKAAAAAAATAVVVAEASLLTTWKTEGIAGLVKAMLRRFLSEGNRDSFIERLVVLPARNKMEALGAYFADFLWKYPALRAMTHFLPPTVVQYGGSLAADYLVTGFLPGYERLRDFTAEFFQGYAKRLQELRHVGSQAPARGRDRGEATAPAEDLTFKSYPGGYILSKRPDLQTLVERLARQSAQPAQTLARLLAELRTHLNYMWEPDVLLCPASVESTATGPVDAFLTLPNGTSTPEGAVLNQRLVELFPSFEQRQEVWRMMRDREVDLMRLRHWISSEAGLKPVSKDTFLQRVWDTPLRVGEITLELFELRLEMIKQEHQLLAKIPEPLRNFWGALWDEGKGRAFLGLPAAPAPAVFVPAFAPAAAPPAPAPAPAVFTPVAAPAAPRPPPQAAVTLNAAAARIRGFFNPGGGAQ